MNGIRLSLPDRIEKPLFTKNGNRLTLDYPCNKTYDCSHYRVSLPRGVYRFELYGASGGYTTNYPSNFRNEDSSCAIKDEEVISYGGNTNCSSVNSPGAGGYISGVISLNSRTLIYARVGGKGQVSTTSETSKGGFNGGGDAIVYPPCPPSSGGGSSDIRIEKDDLWHRIIVAGGGGGCDDYLPGNNPNDGSGGAGGYPNGQGYWYSTKYVNDRIATQLYGFSFGQGESSGTHDKIHENSTYSTSIGDYPGAGGGWFGGHASNYGNGGAGGGSSFVLTKTAIIPQGSIPTHTSRYTELESHPYAFTTSSVYAMTDVKYVNGIRAGNGLIRITLLSLKTKNNIIFINNLFINVLNLIVNYQEK